ncbi:MAG: hypothetical protein CL917_14620 [Deltaproteobacteria bacterium]|nr:hypothetical protein [Deltaproteobacteria bacterium]
MSRLRSLRSIPPLLLLLLMAISSLGCGSFWASVREGERSRAQSQANTYFKDGRCDRVLRKLDRSEAAQDIGRYGAVATYQRAVCLEKLGAKQSGWANYRMLLDFYPDDSVASLARDALPKEGASPSISQLRAEVASLPMPSQIKIPSPRYTDTAERSGMVGDIVVTFMITGDRRISDIRVVQMDHPLLASWAIEAVSNINVTPAAASLPLPMRSAARIVFSSFWHEDGRKDDREKSNSKN